MKKCFLCGESDDIIDFTDITFEKCFKIIDFRKRKNFKYGDVQLNRSMVTDYGYHLLCFKKVNVLAHKYRAEFAALYPTDKDDATTSTSCNNQEAQQMGDIAMDIPGTSAEKIVPADCRDETTREPLNAPQISFETSRKISEMAAVSDPSAPTATQRQTTDEPGPSSSHSAEETEEMEAEPAGSSTPLSDRGNTPKTCIFCKSARKRVKGQVVALTTSKSTDLINRIRTFAQGLQNVELCEELETCNTLVFHKICKLTYIKSCEKSLEQDQETGTWHETRQFHKSAFEALSAFIHEEILRKERVFYFQDLHDKYVALLLEVSDGKIGNDVSSKFRNEHLQNKLAKHFAAVLAVEQCEGPMSKKIVYSRDMDVSKLLNESIVHENAEQSKLQDLAYKIRNAVKLVEKKPVPDSPLVEDICKGECQVPEMLFEFVCNLVQGPDYRRKNCTDDYIKIKSVCKDLIYIITKGRVKPSKHMMLGLAMKSLTSSRKVLTILNKYGHTISYTSAEELETELAYTYYSSNDLIPPGIDVEGGTCTHVAFDNYDRFVDTSNGKDTLHDTVGIIYQFPKDEFASFPVQVIPQRPETVTDGDISSGTFCTEKPPRKRRRFEVIPRETVAYYKKPCKAIALLPLETIEVILSDCKSAKQDAIMKDLIWAIALSQIPSLPMWVGHNCKTVIDGSEKQTLDYLQPINLSPTSYSVVLQTMTHAMDIAEKCEQDNIIVTYDLAIAKKAMEIQSTESPTYDKLFVNLGAFHTQMAYFKAVGKFIDSCGITDILVQCDILASGSLNGFIECKHFNRCKRIHPLLSGALQILHLERFLSEVDVSPELLTEDLETVISIPIEAHSSLTLPPALREVVKQYKEFLSLTLSGAHGKTAQFYMQYIEYINLFFRFSRSVRTSDFELCVDSIFDMAKVFFIFNQPNYARWSLKYLSNLMNLKICNAPLLDEFRRGAFGVKRTNGSLARAPVDLTLEQTINADAANSLTGISHFTSSISARQRWALSHTVRTRIITQLSEEIDISPKDDISHSLEKSRIEKNRQQLDKLVDGIKQNSNPFDSNLEKQELFNISTGKAASSRVATFLLNSCSEGESQRNLFIQQCEADAGRFSKPISRNSILNFASDCAKTMQRAKDGSKQVLVKMERDTFGRLLAVAISKEIDMEICFRFPLCAVPPALCRLTGDRWTTEKAALSRHIISKVEPSRPGTIDVEIIDGFYFLYLLGQNVPQTFDKIAELILKKICNTDASEIHLIFDRYLTPSIKDTERKARQEQDIPYAIKGPSQTRPTDFQKSLKNYRFKDAMVLFLAEFWENDALVPIIADEKVFLTVAEKCHSFIGINGHIKKTEETNLTCNHEEADTRIVFHIGRLEGDSNVMIRASDTDILVIVLGNIHKFSNLRIWMSSKTRAHNDYQCTDLNNLANDLGAGVCRALPGFHAYTGCDYTAAFYRKGKVRPFKLLEKNERFQKVFADLDDPIKIYDDDVIDTLQEFTCMMYDVKNCVGVDSARFQLFQRLYAKNLDKEHFLSKVKSFDSSLIPPCWKSLKQKILRTSFITAMWMNATNADCVTLNPEECGWVLNGILEPLWFQGDPTPLRVEDILRIEVENDEEDFEVNSSDSECE